MTLSFSTEKKYSKPKGGLKGMSTAEMVSLITGNMPADEKTAESASSLRAELIQMLDKDGLLLHKDSPKTNVILDTLK